MAKKLVLLSSVAIALLSCRDSTGPEEISISVSVDLRAAPFVETVVVTVDAATLTTDLVFNLTIVNGGAFGTVIVPVRLFRMNVRAFDAAENLTHFGQMTLEIPFRTNAIVCKLTAAVEQIVGDPSFCDLRFTDCPYRATPIGFI